MNARRQASVRCCAMVFSWLAAGMLPIAQGAAVPQAAAKPVTAIVQGAPAKQVRANEAYSFTPRSAVTGATRPYYQIENRPRWATFYQYSGMLYGVPGNADVGTYKNIRITLVNGTVKASLPAFSIAVNPEFTLRSLTLSWMPPLTNTDGTPLTDLAAYRLYGGNTPDSLSLIIELDNAGMTRLFIDSLPPDRYYFRMSAVNREGVESDLSPLVSRVLE